MRPYLEALNPYFLLETRTCVNSKLDTGWLDRLNINRMEKKTEKVNYAMRHV